MFDDQMNLIKHRLNVIMMHAHYHQPYPKQNQFLGIFKNRCLVTMVSHFLLPL